MKTRHYSSEAIVLARRHHSEADRIITLLTKNTGKIRLVAKGVRRTTSRKRGSLEIFSHIRFSATKGRNLDVMTESESINNFKGVRKNIKRVAVAYYLVEVTNRLLKEDMKSENIFGLLLSFLERLEHSNSLRKLRYEFASEILIELGYWPKLKKINNIDLLLEEVLESKLNTPTIGKKILL